MRILLAEREADIARSVSAFLRHSNYEVDITDNGVDAFGQWSWKLHKNASGKNNLNLKWIG